MFSVNVAVSVSLQLFYFVHLDVVPQFKRSGISGKGKNIVTKHDPEICGRKNARKVMENVRTNFMSKM